MTSIMRRFGLPCFLSVLLAACVPAIQLRPGSLPEAGSVHGAIAIGNVRDLRPAKNGRGDFAYFGKVRGGYGNPFDLRAARGKALDSSLEVTARSALMNAGYADPSDITGDAALRLDMDVQEFWCDGYMGYKIAAVIVTKLVDNRTDKVLAEKTINASQGFAVTFGYGAMHGAFDRVMNEAAFGMAAFIKSEEFAAAAESR